MAIIVEGMDNSGKSTLAASFGLDVLHPGPRPRNARETKECLERQLESARLPVVMDRVTAISNPAYTGEGLGALYRQYLDDMLAMPHCIVIYCRPPLEAIMDFSRHTEVKHDQKAQVEWMKRNASRLVSNYDKLMSHIPHLKYDYTKPNEEVVKAAFDSVFTMGGWQKWRKMTKM